MKQNINKILRKWIALVLLFIIFYPTRAQQRLSTPLEILDFMEASPTPYVLQQLLGDKIRKQRFVLAHGTFVDVEDGVEHLRYAEDFMSCKALENMHAGRKIMSVEKPKTKKARRFFKKALVEEPENAQLLTLLGETYYQEEKFKEAKKYFNDALALNNIDYLAHWWIAEMHLKDDQLDSAVYSITLAHIYNRNNPRLLIRLQEVYELAEKKYSPRWAFEPQYYIDQEEVGDTVLIVADGIWLTYGMYKAVWNFEEDYVFIKSQQEVTDYLFYEEMEAALGTYMAYENMKETDQRNFPAMRALESSLDKEMLEEYIMYEILLVDRPTVASYLTKPFLKRIMSYIFTVRSQDFAK